MIIVCAGRSRSGSTIMYNLIRLTLEESVLKENVYGRMHRDYDRNNAKKHHIVKIHGYDKYLFENATHVFSCTRNLKQQKASIIKFRKLMKSQDLSESELNEFINYDLNRYNKWKSHKNFVKSFRFDDLVNNKTMIIHEVCRLLGLKVMNNSEVIIKRLNDIKLPTKGYDKETGLTSDHFTSVRFRKLYRGSD